jgi:hypothetical protein
LPRGRAAGRSILGHSLSTQCHQRECRNYCWY